MWEILQVWIDQGIKHILDLKAYDHLLYIVALSLPFALGKYKTLAIQVTAFTIGHTIALVIAANSSLPIPKLWIEIGILISILLTAIYGIAFNTKKELSPLHYIVTLSVGCIHGLGFGNFFAQMHPDKGTEFLTSLIGFNLGVEVGQLFIIFCLIVFIRLIVYANLSHTIVSKTLNGAISLISIFLLFQLLFGN